MYKGKKSKKEKLKFYVYIKIAKDHIIVLFMCGCVTILWTIYVVSMGTVDA